MKPCIIFVLVRRQRCLLVRSHQQQRHYLCCARRHRVRQQDRPLPQRLLQQVCAIHMYTCDNTRLTYSLNISALSRTVYLTYYYVTVVIIVLIFIL